MELSEGKNSSHHCAPDLFVFDNPFLMFLWLSLSRYTETIAIRGELWNSPFPHRLISNILSFEDENLIFKTSEDTLLLCLVTSPGASSR